MSHIQQVIYEKYTKGDALTQYELDIGIEFHSKLSNDLFKLGPTFHLAAAESAHVAMTLDTYRRSIRLAKEEADRNSPEWKAGYKAGTTSTSEEAPAGPPIYSSYTCGETPNEFARKQHESIEANRRWRAGWAAGRTGNLSHQGFSICNPW